MILITGATGQQGGAVAQALLNQGEKIRVMSRSREKLAHLEKQGAEVCVGDFANSASIKQALEGVERAFLVTTWHESGCDAEIAQGRQFIDAAKETDLQYLVYSSVGGATTNSGVPHFETKMVIEMALKEWGIPRAILRPAFFMENFGSPWFLPMILEGKLRMPLGPYTPLQVIALETVGAFGAAALTHPDEFTGQTIELASDELTMPDAMAKLSRAIGRQIGYEEMPSEQAEQAYGYEFTLMFNWFRQHGFIAQFDELKQWELPLVSFEEHLKHAGWAAQLARASVS